MAPDRMIMVSGRECPVKMAWNKFLLGPLEDQEQRQFYARLFPTLNGKTLRK